MTALSDLLDRLNVERWSARAVAKKATDLGHPLSHDTANNYMRGRHGVPDEDTLSALAAVFHADVEKLRRAAGLASGDLGPYEPPTESRRLGQRERDLVDELIRMLAANSAREELAQFASGMIRGNPEVAELWLASPDSWGERGYAVSVSTGALEDGAISDWPEESDISSVFMERTEEGPRFYLATRDGQVVELEVMDAPPPTPEELEAAAVEYEQTRFSIAPAAGSAGFLADAARDVGKLSKGQQRRANAANAGEPEPNDPDDIEPR